MKICFVASVLGQGGAERQLYYILKTLRSMEISCYLICFTQHDFWENPIADLGVSIIHTRHKNKLLRLAEIFWRLFKGRFDIVQSVHFQTNFYVAVAARLLNMKHIGAIRSNLSNEIAVLGLLGLPCLYLPEIMVANSKTAIRKAVELGRSANQLHYLPNIIDETLFSPVDDTNSTGKVIGIFLGTLWQLKRVDRIIQLARRCLDANLPVEFHLYGDGVLGNQLIALAKSNGAFNKNVFFMGRTDNPTKALQSGNFLILTSDYEGTPNVVLEAMSCGLAVVSTDVGDVSDLIINGVNGFIIPLDDDQGLFESIQKLTSDPGMLLAMKNNNLEKIRSSRSFSLLRGYLINLYSSLLAVDKWPY